MEQIRWSKWTEEEVSMLEELYPKPENKKHILDLLPHRSWGSIRVKASKIGVSMGKNKSLLDFSVIDTEEKAYILGFIAADGCVYCSNRKYGYWALSINLSEKDRGLLERIKMILCPRLKLATINYANTNWTTGCQLTVCDNKLCEDLKSHGVTERKSKTLRPCLSIPDHLINHYIRGYFDGDGSFWVRKGDGRLYAGFAGSEYMMAYISTWFKQKYKHECKLRKKEGCYLLTYCGFTAINLAKLLYTNATIYLERKYLRVEKFLDKKRQEHVIDKLNGGDICNLYKELGTWTKVAEYLGVNVSYISRIKDGKRGKIGKLNCDKFN